MKKALIFSGFLFIANAFFITNALAQHTGHDYVGSHGMAIFLSPEGEVFAHHLPLYSKPHDYQLIYKVRLADKARSMLKQTDLVTLLPETFDLAKLIEGQPLTLSATVFSGHFERGGQEIYNGNVEFIEPVYIRNVNNSKSKNKTITFEHVLLDDGSHLIVHRIGPRPSFDAVAWLPNTQKFPTNRITNCGGFSEAPTSHLEIKQLLQSCFDVTPSYTEYQDFQ